MSTLLLTGFEPFTTGRGLALEHNPTSDYAQRVAAQVPGVTSAVLPVSYGQTPRALEALHDSHAPWGWVGMGYAPHRTTLDLEVFAVNMEHALGSDNDGERPSLREIVPGGPAAYRLGLDVQDVLRHFRGLPVPVQPAFHAGTFLCNQVFYLGCHAVAQGRLSVAAFFHVPPMPDPSAFEAGMVRWLQALTADRTAADVT